MEGERKVSVCTRKSDCIQDVCAESSLCSHQSRSGEENQIARERLIPSGRRDEHIGYGNA